MLNCLYCNNGINLIPLTNIVNYYHCNDCRCEYLEKNEILAIIKLSTSFNNKHYMMELDLIKNQTNLIVDSLIVQTHPSCTTVTPQNINNKIQTWLLMQ